MAKRKTDETLKKIVVESVLVEGEPQFIIYLGTNVEVVSEYHYTDKDRLRNYASSATTSGDSDISDLSAIEIEQGLDDMVKMGLLGKRLIVKPCNVH